MRKAVFIYSPQIEKYHYPPNCPFDISRAGKTRKILNSMELLSGNGKSEIVPVLPQKTVIEKFHSACYLDVLKTTAKGHWSIEALNMGIGTPDCPVFSDMYDCAILACGGTLSAANLILTGSADVVFNPSGGFHHAGPECAAGFCYINDVVLACMVLAEEEKRVLYLDVDVHHSDGVQNAFYDRSDVMTISFHESPKTLFPGTGFKDEIGTGRGKGYCVNVPLPTGTYDEAYMKAFKTLAIPLIEAYNPDVIVFELGADALAGDPLAHLCLTNNVYADISNLLMRFDKPILMTGGGGYNIDNTVRAWALAWSVLCGADTSQDMNLSLGGVMLENTDWQGGLRDRVRAVHRQQPDSITQEIEAVIKTVKANVFCLHGL